MKLRSHDNTGNAFHCVPIFRPDQGGGGTRPSRAQIRRCPIWAGLFIAIATQAAQFKFPNQTLTVPDGFEVERVGAPPEVDRPIYGSFDEQGRLYVVDSSGSNDKPDKQLEQKPHRLVRLEDTNADGRFDKTTVFADRLMFPEGCLWYDGSVYVAAPPSIWKFTDTN